MLVYAFATWRSAPVLASRTAAETAELPIETVPFDPESILSAEDRHGLKLMKNALKLCRPVAQRRCLALRTLRSCCSAHTVWP